MSEFLTPRLLITDYYDSLINQLDIYTEELMKQLKKNLVPEYLDSLKKKQYYYYNYTHNYYLEGLKNQYISETKLESTKNHLLFSSKLKEKEDELNNVRQKAIDGIRKVQEKNLDFYNANKDNFKVDRENLTDDKLEELKTQLFANGFCFIIDFEKDHAYWMHTKAKTWFKLCTVITDFYLRESDIDHITANCFTRGSPMYKKFKKGCRFDQGRFLADRLAEYIIEEHSNKLEVIYVTKNSLFDVKHISFQHNREFDEVDFRFDIDFSAIQSLSIMMNSTRLSDFSAFVNLKYLSICRIVLCDRPFENLRKLVKIEMKYCDLSQFDFDSLNSITSLQAINLIFESAVKRQCSLKIDLNRLINLKSLELSLYEEISFELISNSFNQLILLKVCRKQIDFLDRVDLQQLKYLEISHSKQTSKLCFNSMRNLTELNLNNNYFKDLDLINTDLLEKLEILDLSYNGISVLKKGVFSKLKSLKILNLNCNGLKKIETGAFEGLECLENLELKSNPIDIRKIDKRVFDELKSLKFLFFKDYEMRNYDEMAHLKREGLIIC